MGIDTEKHGGGRIMLSIKDGILAAFGGHLVDGFLYAVSLLLRILPMC